ncbi:hypothetical protein GG344DRAFT_83706 [Lentinula edodes]|nr:hypothetical protein GG344DRAFT_83706 [Lentinula edodes]
MSVASGLDLFCSSRMAIHLLQPVIAASSIPDSGKVYALFEEAAPFLIYIRDFWIGRANCPLFAGHVLYTAAFLSQKLPAFFQDSLNQQWGVPLEDHSSFLSSQDLKRFPSIPIPFCLRFREGSAIMCLVPLEDLDPFSALRSSMAETRPLPGGTRVSPPAEDSTESSEENQSVAPPKSNKRKRELVSLMADASTILDRRSNVKSPSKEDRPVLPKASSSKKKVEKPAPKPKATAWSKTSVKMVEESRAAKGKSRQMEVLEVEESETEEEVVPPPSKHLKSSKSAPALSKTSTFCPTLLIDDQGHLKLPGDSVEGFTPFKWIEHARNSAPLQRQNPIFDVNPEFLGLGVILTTQKASFTMQDLLQINRSIRDITQACVLALSRGEFNPNASRLPGLKCESCTSRSLKCMCLLDVDLAMNALNVFHVATTSSTLNLTSSLRHTQELRMQLDGLGALFDQARQSFLGSFLDLQQAGQDPIVVLEALKAAKPQRESFSVEDWTLLATLFQWCSPFNLNGLKFDNRTPAEWIDLLRSIHSGASSATVTMDGHLVDTSQPPEAAVEVSEALDT